jgi:hypothetical protein
MSDAEALSRAREDIAALKAQGAAQGREIGELKAMVAAMTTKLDAVATTLTEARGGWKLMMLLGGGAATFGSMLTWFVTHMTGRGAP